MADEVGESLKLNIKITSTGEDKLQTIAKSVATLEKSLSLEKNRTNLPNLQDRTH